ncbi:MAG: T9SS type A sorting domain-containing protein [Bacteroidetes bacterium]|nr:T9SS type A sorting domain-containing protein [Bacteroidota bacterium]
MKKILLMSAMLLGGIFSANAQITVSGDITTNTTWTKNNIYMLTGGFVYVTSNATLTIEAGTLIKGNASTLIITRGAKIMTNGTQTEPIVFTSYQPAGSRAPGDWGGIILCGKAPINDPAGSRLAEGGIDPVKGLYGGTDPNDNSGILNYVRIEYAGIAYLPNNETNGLTMGGVGMGTTIDYVQVIHGGDDAFEWFGGTVNCKHLVSSRGVDDHFDTDYGFSGKIQFAVALADSAVADISGSNGFESDNDAGGSTNAPLTHPIFTNVSFFGPKKTATTTINGNHKRGAHLRRSTALCVYNSFFAGFPTGLKLESDNSANNAKFNSLQYKNNIIAGCPQVIDSAGLTITWGAPYNSVLGWFNFPANGNSTLPNSLDIMATNPYSYTNPNFLLMAGSPALTGASFSSPNLSDPFFTPTTYRGAFDGVNDWTKCWTNFDPQNTPYTTAGINYLAVNVTTSGSTTFCAGGSVTLTSDATSGNVWSTSATTSSINVTASGSYSVTVSNAAGCVVTTSPIVVTVNALPTPTVTAGGPTTFCAGGSVTLSTGTFPTYSWSSGATTSSAVISTGGNQTVTVTDANGCVGTSPITAITVNPLPSVPTISAGGPTSFCTGGSVVLTSSYTGGNTWSTSATTDAITVNSTGSYSVTQTDVNGCSSTSVATNVNVSSAPLPTVSVAGSTALCAGESVTLSASTADTYLWSPGGQTTQTIVVTAAGTYNVTTTNADACDGVGTSSNTVVTVNPVPTAAGAVASTTGFNVTFSNTSSGATSYSWDFGDLSSSSATAPVHAYASNGTYTVTLIASNGACSDTITFNTTLSVGVEEIQTIAGVNLYPNPVRQEATIDVNLNEATNVSVFVYDITGKVVANVFDGQMDAGMTTLKVDASNLEAGIYFTTIVSNNAKKTLKMVVVK